MQAPAGEEFTKQIPTEWMVNAKCYAVIDLWSQENEWKWVKKLQRQIQVSFETDQMWEFWEKWTLPLTIHKKYSFFITDSSNLSKDLTSRLGKADPKMNIFDLVGKTAELMVLHTTSKNGKVYPKIMAIKPWKKDRELINPEVMFSLDSSNEDEFLKIPERLRTEIQKSPEYNKAVQRVETNDDDLPF